MPTEKFNSSDLVAAIVQRAGLAPEDYDLEAPSNLHMSTLEDKMEPTQARREFLRDVDDKNQVKEDLDLLSQGKLDKGSFVSGYVAQEHPVEYLIHDSNGVLKQKIHSANLRTLVGGEQQGQMLFGDVPANYYGMSAANLSGTATSLTTTTVSGQVLQVINNTGASWPTAANGTSPLLTGGLAGKMVYLTGGTGNQTNGCYATIISNTATALTVDRFKVPGTEAAVSLTGTPAYTILPLASPYNYIALNNSSAAVATADISGTAPWNQTTTDSGTSVLGELTQAGMGRTIVSTTAAANGTSNPSPTWYSVTNGNTTNVTNQIPNGATVPATGTQQLVVKFVAGGGGGSWATVWKSALFNGPIPCNGAMGFEALLATAGTLASGDSLTVTWQIQF